jgi:hypothetical protein
VCVVCVWWGGGRARERVCEMQRCDGNRYAAN